MIRLRYTDKALGRAENRKPYGGVAQLGERLNGIQEVNGSIPSVSTKRLEKPLENT